MGERFYAIGINELISNTSISIYEKNKVVDLINNKVFTLKEIEIISERLLYDVLKELVWIKDEIPIIEKATTISVLSQIIGFDMNIYPVRKELMDDTIKGIATDKFYTRVEIENFSAKYGYSVYDCFMWQSIMKKEIKIPGYPLATKYEKYKELWVPD